MNNKLNDVFDKTGATYLDLQLATLWIENNMQYSEFKDICNKAGGNIKAINSLINVLTLG